MLVQRLKKRKIYEIRIKGCVSNDPHKISFYNYSRQETTLSPNGIKYFVIQFYTVIKEYETSGVY